MCPIVMSTTYGEREGKLDLARAWEILGGLPCSGICGYIADFSDLEMNEAYTNLIEKKAENVYRTIKQQVVSFPASNQAVRQKVLVSQNIDLTPQESEQLSQYAADDSYVQQQKEDIQELASMFRGMMSQENADTIDDYSNRFEKHFHPLPGFKASYKIAVEGTGKVIGLRVNGKELQYSDEMGRADVEAQITQEAMNEIMAGRMTFQRAFMGGDMKMKGDFKVLRTLDEIFIFM